MRKLTMYPVQESATKVSHDRERITLQFRVYDKTGHYIVPEENETGTFTIHIKNLDLSSAKAIITNALMNSPYMSKHFEVEE